MLISAYGCREERNPSEGHHSGQSMQVEDGNIRFMIRAAAERSGVDLDGADTLQIGETGTGDETVVVIRATLKELPVFFSSIVNQEQTVEISKIILERMGAELSTLEEFGHPDDLAKLRAEITLKSGDSAMVTGQEDGKIRPTRKPMELWTYFSGLDLSIWIARLSIEDDQIIVRGRTVQSIHAGTQGGKFLVDPLMSNFNWQWSKRPDSSERVSDFELVGALIEAAPNKASHANP